jgi:hypothetical protein
MPGLSWRMRIYWPRTYKKTLTYLRVGDADIYAVLRTVQPNPCRIDQEYTHSPRLPTYLQYSTVYAMKYAARLASTATVTPVAGGQRPSFWCNKL